MARVFIQSKNLSNLKNFVSHSYYQQLYQEILFAKAWKNARISPIPKVDQPKSEEHFRPLSFLLTLSKVFEKLVVLQMTTFCESESVLRDTIFSFRKGYSTNTVVMGMGDDLLRAMKKGEVTLMVLADFSEAFGTVNYKVLITKLSTLGFSKLFLRWLNSYLSDRSHSYRSMIVHLNQ